jgi:acylphosphatase
MSSEFLASGENVLDSNLGGAWDIINGYAGRKRDLGVARRFGGSAAAYSLRDIGAMNGRVVKARRDVGETSDPEEDFSASQVQSGALEDWVNGKLESTLPADVATAAAAYSLRKVKASYSGDAVRIRRSSDDIEVDVAFDSDDKVSASSAITNVAEQGGESGSTSATTLGSFLSEKAPNFSGNSLNFDGSSTYVQVTQFALSGDFTVSFDVFVDFNNGGGGRIAGRTSAAGWIGNLTDGSLTVRADGQSGKTISFDSTLSSGEHSFILTRSSGTISLSIDGVTQSDTESETNNFTINFIGRQAGNYFKGSIRNINFGSASYNGYGNTNSDWQDQVGSNNGTVNGTADKFLGDSAFVHTWYDQAGSNDAVQATDANQPKIAENGALLADGLDFDGSNDFLGFGADICDNINNFSAFTIAKSDGGNGAAQVLFSVGSSSNGTVFAQDRNDLFIRAIFGNGTDASQVVTMSQAVSQFESGMLFTTIGGSSTSKGFADAVEGGSVSSASANPTNTTGGIGMHAGSSSPFDGSVKEAIFYNSDQSANRFKIESNINNYYGLYNDANEFSANAQVDGTGSTVSNASKDGGTLTLSSASGNNYLYFQLTKTVPATSGDVFVSFNYESSNESVTLNNVKLRDDSGSAKSGDLVDSEGNSVTIQKNGFYSGKLASANLTNTGTRLAFLTNQTTDGYTFTISNLRVSRIARNGFVETWYDQSGNGNNATQASANNQPKIVVNGGIMTLENGTPSLGFNRSGGLSHFTLSSGISNEPYTFFATTVHNGLNYFRIFAESNNPPSIILNSASGGSIVYYPSDSDNSGTLSTTAIFSDNIVSGFSGVNGGADGIVRINGTNLKTDISRTQAADSITQIGRFPNTSAPFSNIESLVIYESDLSSDFDTIEKELAQPINIL